MSRILAAYDRSIFKFTPNFMTVTFPVEVETKESESDTKGDTKDDTKDDTKETLESVLTALRRQPSVTRAGLASQLTISSATVSRAIKTLVETKRISRGGSRRSGHWEVLDTESDKKDGKKDGRKDGTKEPLKAVLAVLRGHPSITLDDIASQLKISPRTASRTIKTLVETKQISRAGGRRFGHWVALDE